MHINKFGTQYLREGVIVYTIPASNFESKFRKETRNAIRIEERRFPIKEAERLRIQAYTRGDYPGEGDTTPDALRREHASAVREIKPSSGG